MSQPLDESQTQRWQQRFASLANNRAWELSLLDRTPAQDREMLDAAHASAWHWSAIGVELNRQRATMLLAQVHALLGDGHDYFVGRDTPDWELAFTHAIHAHAAHAAGAVDLHRAAYARAVTALQAVADDEDRRIVAQTFHQVPVP